ncbi:MAG: aminopeptidase [Candidatus Nanoarchaeia archaeon]|nr:aminopeptidase [Candidatus Nanoarchaeia archaeon]
MDPRNEKIANILVDYSVKVKKGETVQITGSESAKDLLMELYKKVLEKGAYPILDVNFEGTSYLYYKTASEEQLKKFPDIAMFKAKKADAYISVWGDLNTRELSNIDSKKIALRRKIVKPISDVIHNKDRWVIFDYPTNALAMEADMSLKEFEDFVYKACIIDYSKMKKGQEKLKQLIDHGNKVRIIGEETDIELSIKGRLGINNPGVFNVPDGEVFTSPVENSANGYIFYTFPGIYMGKEVSGIRLKFEKGKVVKATAEKNEDLLKNLIKMDAGSSRLGELGIGTNYNIDKFIKNILFDEKIGGTIHLALGHGFKEAGGKNKSALHWDMIKDLRKRGEILIDDKLIQRNGKFTFKF